jgi:hypothetical protein
MRLDNCICACAIFLLSASAPAWAGIQVVGGTPAGFERLDAPRPTSVTLYYGGELLGHFPAHITPSQLAFDDPEAIMNAIPAIADEAAVGSALASPLALHPELLCGPKRVEECGTLTPQVAGIIFDEAHLSAELFIGKQYLSVVSDDKVRYLPLPERNFSSVYRFDGAVSGTDQAKPNFSLGNNAVMAVGEGNLAAQTTLSNEGLRFDTANMNIERQGWSASGGLMRTLPMQLASDRDMAGVSVATSTRTRLDAHKTEGNDVIVYLPRRSFVSIYREGRLYSSHSYEAGNQRLDTRELPDGAYTITLKIQETDGELREETRFFAKSEQIPPPDAPVYYAQGGVVRQPPQQDAAVPKLTDAPIVRAGTVRRVDDNVGMNVGVLGISDRAAVEAGTFLVIKDTQLRVGALGSTAGDAGAQATLVYGTERWNAAVDARKLWAGSIVPEEYEGLLSDISQVTASVGYSPLSQVSITARGSYSHTKNMPAITSFGPAVDWRIWQQGESTLHMSADAARINGRNEGAAIMRFSYRIGEYGVTGEGGAGYGGNSHGEFGSARVWNQKTSADESLLVGAGAHSDARARSLSADGDWRNNIGHVQGAAQQTFGPGVGGTTYGGNFALGAAQAEDMLHLGGSESDMSAVVVEPVGDTDEAMTIFINGTPRGIVHVGQRQVVYLSPYETYRIRLAPSNAVMLSVEDSDRKVTLYPGNVVRMSWKVNSFAVVVGRIVTPDGKPLADAALDESAFGITTNTNGRFQAEIAHPKILNFTSGNTHCRVNLPQDVAAQNGVLMFAQPLVCINQGS